MSECKSSKDDLIEIISSCVCSKPLTISIDECFKQKKSSACWAYGKCRIKEKTGEQLLYVCSPLQEKIFLNACPGSGKTEVVGLKAAFETKKWKSRHSGIAFLTFTNNAASVIGDRVIQLMGVEGVSYPHYIGTIDSWFHRYIAQPFGSRITGYKGIKGDHSIRIIEESSKAGFLNNFTTKYKINHREYAANKYYYDLLDGGIRFVENYNNDSRTISLQDWQERDLKDTKIKFLSSGFATYKDIDFICNEVLKNTQLAQLIASRFPNIIIDECQDLTTNQLKLIEKLISVGVIVHFIGDLQQSIFEFAGASQGAITQFLEKENFKEFHLTGNFRSPQAIVDVCDKLVNQKGTCGYGERKGANPICLYFPYANESDMSKLPDKFSGYLTLLDYIDIEKTAILARGYGAISKIRLSGGTKKPIGFYPPVTLSVWQKQNRSREQTEEAFSLMGKFLSEKVFFSKVPQPRKYYCPESVSSPIQWRLFLANILNRCCSDGKMMEFQQDWSTWAKYFDDNFVSILRKEAERFETIAIPKNVGKVLKSPPGEAKNPVSDSIQNHKNQSINNVRTTTFHKIKGETLDAVLIVSSPTAQGGGAGYWCKWLEDPDSENARFAYVASSRPKYLLAWSLPERSLDEKSKQKLAELGFSEAIF